MRGTVLDASVIAQRILAGAHGHVERGSYRRVHTAVEAAPLRVSSSLGELAGRARAVCIRTAIPIGPNRTGRRRGTRGRAGLAVASHAVQLYIAPVEKVLEGHVSYPVLSALAFVPAAAVAQKPAPAPEYLPATQSSHTEAPTAVRARFRACRALFPWNAEVALRGRLGRVQTRRARGATHVADAAVPTSLAGVAGRAVNVVVVLCVENLASIKF